MTKYIMDDGKVFNTALATESWGEENTNTGIWETMHLSSKGRFAIEIRTQWQGSRNTAVWMDNRDALEWLLRYGYTLPECLESTLAEVEE
jgi:hypothetical protein